MADKIPDATRHAIEQAIREGAGTVSCRGLAREHGVSAGTVRNIAKAAGLAGAFTRASVENATRARGADMASRRARIAEDMLDLADHLVKRARAPYEVWIGTPQGAERVTYDEPPLNEVRQAMTAIGIAVDKHMALIRFDTKDNGNATALALVDALAASLNLDGQGAGDDGYDGYPVPLPTPEEIAAGAAALDADAAAVAPTDSEAATRVGASPTDSNADGPPVGSPAGAGGDLG
jgi:hypothetical protein